MFCVGIPLAWGASTALTLWPGEAAWLDPALILGGVAALAAVALWPVRRREVVPRPGPARAAA